MSDTNYPFKLTVLHALTNALADITPANGYQTDMSPTDRGDGVLISRVYRGRSWFGDNDPIPMLSVIEGVDPGEPVPEPLLVAQQGQYDWNLLVQGFIDDDPENPTDPAYVLLADVKKRLAVEVVRNAPGTHTRAPLGLPPKGRNVVSSMSVGTGVVRPADDLSSKAYFWLSVVLRITEDAAFPYG